MNEVRKSTLNRLASKGRTVARVVEPYAPKAEVETVRKSTLARLATKGRTTARVG